MPRGPADHQSQLQGVQAAGEPPNPCQAPTAVLHPPPSQDGANSTPGCSIPRSVVGQESHPADGTPSQCWDRWRSFFATTKAVLSMPVCRCFLGLGLWKLPFPFPCLSSIFEQVEAKPRRAEGSANKGRRGGSRGELCMPQPTLLQRAAREETWAQPVDKGEQGSHTNKLAPPGARD